MKYLLCFMLLFVCSSVKANTHLVFGAEHISSWFDGRPFNSRRELALDMVYAGISYEKNNWTLDFLVSHALQNPRITEYCDTIQTYSNSQPVNRYEDCYYMPSFQGSNPRAVFRIERKFKIGDK